MAERQLPSDEVCCLRWLLHGDAKIPRVHQQETRIRVHGDADPKGLDGWFWYHVVLS